MVPMIATATQRTRHVRAHTRLSGFRAFSHEVHAKLAEAEADRASGVAPLDAATVFRNLHETYGY